MNNPLQSIRSGCNRHNNVTPQVYPKQTPWNEPVTGMIFFALPANIGELIGGYSTYYEGHKKLTFFQYLAYCIKKSAIASVLVAVIMGVLFVAWSSNNVANPGRKAIIGFSILYGIVLLFIFSVNKNLRTFRQVNYFIGVNGFAYFMFEGGKENIVEKMELNFNNVTHLFTSEVKKYKNLHYDGTDFSFVWFNNIQRKVKFKVEDSYLKEDGELPKQALPFYWMSRVAEIYWTIYLMDNIEKELAEKGYIQFDANFDNELMPFVRLAPGKITVLNGQYNTYTIDEIKRAYTKKGNLYFEHINYNKSFIFFESGKKDFIPLDYLGNKQFFVRALELLLGIKID